ncbi:MAG: Uma2 family endonuclease [Betaproteobacteria bacterium]|nr:Uma2 family endonuclease [Betaproteobacteria bacterium]
MTAIRSKLSTHMSATPETIEAPLAPEQLARRWQAMCVDPVYENIAGKIELTEWGEVLMSPVGKSHGLAAARFAACLEQTLGGRTVVEVGIATAIGLRAPDVAWCSDAYLAARPEEMPLSSAPEICVEIASASNALPKLPKLREKAMAYVKAGAVEAWIVFPQSRRLEIYDAAGSRESTSFKVNPHTLFD